jgi:hypothetical protein
LPPVGPPLTQGGSDDNGGGLPVTGPAGLTIVGAGIAVIAAGIVLMFTARRRRIRIEH